MPVPDSHARHNLSDGESVTTPKIEPQCTHAVRLEHSGKKAKPAQQLCLRGRLPPPRRRRMPAGDGAPCAQSSTQIHSSTSHCCRFHDGRVSGRRESAPCPATAPRWDHHRSDFAVQHAAFGAAAMTD
ncbi:hypothetical protein TcCL_Unassigned02789 [Trypanosoma cruzi]|nr:hypothetical protein TcCL_Unassigned02789 [Trypanosoma cruzi]